MRSRLGPIALLFAMLLLCLPLPAVAQFKFLQDNFFDPADGAFDIASWLDAGGFIPVPIVITEPAVSDGAGLAGIFIHTPPPGQEDRPGISGAVVLATGNNSEGYAAFHQGHYLDDRLRYFGAAAYLDINLDLFHNAADSLQYNVKGSYLSQSLQYRLGDSPFFLGADWDYFNSDFSFKLSGQPPPPGTQASSTLSALSLTLSYDSFDNIFTPTGGWRGKISVGKEDKAWGSDYDFTRLGLSLTHFFQPAAKWTFGGHLRATAVEGDAPFFVLPFIQLRGIPAVRYQGNRVVSFESEVRYQLSDRWSILGFAGTGIVDESLTLEEDAKFAGGGGIRYLLSRKHGLHAGIDIARGPEETVFYLQIGTAWR